MRGLSPILALLLAAPFLAATRHADGPYAVSSGVSSGVSFARDVRPILAERCVLCHGPDATSREAGLRLDRPDDEIGGWLSDLGGYSAVAPGAPEESELLARVRADEGDRMPPADHGPALTPEEVATLTRWIEEGATYEEHWAYAPARPVIVPAVSAGAWPRNEVDLFVARALQEQGLAPQPEADRRSLLRRVSFDLTGLPPTPDELAAFLADESPDAYERVVDRLLASPAYAEHWTRAWLDLARYADSHGYTIDGGRTVWPWRDWVLRAIDADLPYDEFTVTQIAGDLLPDATNADVVATGFHRNTQINQEGGAKDEENRVNAVHDRVVTTGAVWLGTTMSCAQCHDHKYDPVSQRDYYRLFATFNSTEDGGVTGGPSAYVASTPEEEVRVAAYEARVAAAERAWVEASDVAAGEWATWQPTTWRTDNGPELRAQHDGSYRVYGQGAVYTEYELTGAVPPAGVAALRLEALPGAGLSGNGPGRANGGNFVLTGVRVQWRADDASEWREVEITEAVADFEQDTRAEGGGHYPAAHVLDDDPKSGWAVKPEFGAPHLLHLTLDRSLNGGELRVALEQRFGGGHSLGAFRLRTRAEVDAAPPRVPEAWRAAFADLLAATNDRPRLPSTLVLRERPVPRPSHVFERGSFLDPGDPVAPGVPAAFAHLAPDAQPGDRPRGDEHFDRLALARWLASPDNALVHRVTVNRWWQAFFGLGVVTTENDLGLRGGAPSHPELLEWLGRDFAAHGMSRKHVHRRIVTSATYRQASPPWDAQTAADPRNRLLGRQRRLRLDAESIRDAALVASGLYAPRFGGAPVQPPQPAGMFAFTQSNRNWEASDGDDRFRRTLYTRRWRSAVFPFLTTFDAPVPNVACTRRERTTSPLQALTLANDPMMLELAAALGRRAREEGRGEEGDEGDAGGLRRGYELALSRPPTATEERVLLEFLAAERARAGATEDDVWAAFGRVLVNLDEFVTRP